jgi:hypothetical protein
MNKIIQISDEFFWGFNIIINLDNYKTLDELANLLKTELIAFLKKHNLLNQVDIANKLNLHNHLYKNYKDLYRNDYDIIYFCNCCFS